MGSMGFLHPRLDQKNWSNARVPCDISRMEWAMAESSSVLFTSPCRHLRAWKISIRRKETKAASQCPWLKGQDRINANAARKIASECFSLLGHVFNRQMQLCLFLLLNSYGFWVTICISFTSTWWELQSWIPRLKGHITKTGYDQSKVIEKKVGREGKNIQYHHDWRAEEPWF